jgi:hypothetical protein
MERRKQKKREGENVRIFLILLVHKNGNRRKEKGNVIFYF